MRFFQQYKNVKIFIIFTFAFSLGILSVFGGKYLKNMYLLKKIERKTQETKRDYEYAFGVFDGVGLYQKNGRIEEYGLSMDQHHTGPIHINDTEIQLEHDKNVFVWFPDNIFLGKDIFPEISGHDLQTTPFIIGIVRGGVTYLFHTTKESPSSPLFPKDVPDDIKNFFKNTITSSLFLKENTKETFRGKSINIKNLANLADGPQKIEAVFLMFPKTSDKKIHIKDFSLWTSQHSETKDPMTDTLIMGKITGDRLPLGDYITLRTENNTQQKIFLNFDQTFVCERPKGNAPLSISYRYKERDYYTQFGRWIDPKTPLDDLVISLEPSYLNTTGAFSDPKGYKFIGAGTPGPQDNIYAPHSRQYWNGLNTIQCYQGIPFTNNMGYLDRDRFPLKKDGVLRIVHMGGSSSVALQIKTYEKYNILLEQELGLLLQRPVEVISIGRDNGDIGTHYKRFSFFVEHFKPDLVLIENMSGLMMQIHPDLLKRAHGFDFEKNIFPHFTYNDKGSLEFVSESPEYGLHTQKPNAEELTKGVPLWESLKVPFDHMHPSAKEAWTYLKDIFLLYQKQHPHTKMALHTGIDQAQCMQPCKVSTTPEGIPYGLDIFIKNMDHFYKEHHITHFNPLLRPELNHPHTKLTFEHDGHYSVRGHQWLARELAPLLKKYSQKSGL